MEIQISLASARVRTKRSSRSKNETPLGTILTSSELKLLKKWCVDGSQSKSDVASVFRTIRKKLERAGEYVEGKKSPIYRGVNLSAAQFVQLSKNGQLPSKASLSSWTTDLAKARRYATGSMASKPGPFALILKKPSGSYDSDVIIHLRDLAGRVADHFGEQAPFNREILLKSSEVNADEILYVFSAERAMLTRGGKFETTLNKLSGLGYVSPKVNIGPSAVLKFNSRGQLVPTKAKT